MFTLGYSFRPWREAKAIADGLDPSLHQAPPTARVDRRVRYHRRCACRWSSSDARWTVEVENAESGELERLTAISLRIPLLPLRRGLQPALRGRLGLRWRIVHPSTGRPTSSGRTARCGHRQRRHRRHARPALAARASHVTMLQRSPSYVMSLPEHDGIADLLRHLLPSGSPTVVRWKNVCSPPSSTSCAACTQADGAALEEGCGEPAPGRLRRGNHFSPATAMDQRLCFVPTRPLQGIEQRAGVVVPGRSTADRRRVLLDSGATLDADIIVSATGSTCRCSGHGHHRRRAPLDLAESVATRHHAVRCSNLASRSVTPTRRGRSRRTRRPLRLPAPQLHDERGAARAGHPTRSQVRGSR